MKILKIFLPVLFLLSMFGTVDCEEVRIKYNETSLNYLDTNQKFNLTIRDAVEFANMLMEGDVVKAERKFSKDIPYWKIDLITPDKGLVSFEISLLEKQVIRINASEGPFEYEITPADNLISYSAARKIAEELSGLKILKWNYFKSRNTWEYNFWLFTKSGKAQVRVNAQTGEIMKSRKKIIK